MPSVATTQRVRQNGISSHQAGLSLEGLREAILQLRDEFATHKHADSSSQSLSQNDFVENHG